VNTIPLIIAAFDRGDITRTQAIAQLEASAKHAKPDIYVVLDGARVVHAYEGEFGHHWGQQYINDALDNDEITGAGSWVVRPAWIGR
jgi:hypothetical protein